MTTSSDMRSLSLTFLALFATVAVACASPASSDNASENSAAESSGRSKKLLDCNVFLSGGPDQEVTIVQNADGSLTLKELTDDGDEVSRDLSEEEWESGKITLRHDRFDLPTDVNLFYKEGRSWMYKSEGAMGNADCE